MISKSSHKINRIAELILRTADDYQYIHDPEHRNKPHGKFWPTDKGWSNDPKHKTVQQTPTWANPHVTPEMESEYNKAIEENDEWRAKRIVEELAYQSGYEIQNMYHGTTHDFTVFNTQNANVENDLGKGFYFTNSADDAGSNYVGVGPDLTTRLEQFIDRNEHNDELIDLFEKRIEEGKIKKGAHFRKFLKDVAKKYLVGKGKRLMDVVLNLKNPAVLEYKGGTFLDCDSGYNEETEEYEDEPKGKLFEFFNAINEIGSSSGGNYEAEGDINELQSEFMEGGYLADVIKAVRENDNFSVSEDEDGNFHSCDIIRQALERIGFDGVIDKTVNEKFGSKRKMGRPMAGVYEGTEHVIMFNPNQIKSQDPFTYMNPKGGKSKANIVPLSQRFNPNLDDIRY
jgi:hypothetical protein